MNNYFKNIYPGDNQSLRGYLHSLEDDEIIQLLMRREDYLLTAICQILEQNKKYPVINIIDLHNGRQTIANVFANRGQLRRAVHNILDTEKAAEKFRDLEYIDNAPVQECCLLGEKADVLELPVFRHFSGDAGRYITSGFVIARDPENGRCNMSFHRMQLKGKRRIGISMHSRGDLFDYFNRSKKMKRDLETAVIIGTHPSYYIAAASKIPKSQDDYCWAGAFLNQTPIVTKAITVDIPVPAYAEYVLEGKILVDQYEDEGPFGEYTGFSTNRSTRNIFEVSAISHRKDAIYHDLIPGDSWEHILLSQLTKEIVLLQKLQKEIPEVMDLSFPKSGCHFHAYLKIKSNDKGKAKQAMLMLFGLDPYLKLIISVSENIDIHKEPEVLWAMATQVQANRDIFIIPNVICNYLDPSSSAGVSAKMGVDATGVENTQLSRLQIPKDTYTKAEKILKTVL